jgi:hypothetical protein
LPTTMLELFPSVCPGHTAQDSMVIMKMAWERLLCSFIFVALIDEN